MTIFEKLRRMSLGDWVNAAIPIVLTRKFLVFAVVVSLIWIGRNNPRSTPEAPAPAVAAQPLAPAQPPVLDPPQASIESAKARLMKEPAIKDVMYQRGQAVEWTIGVFDNGRPRHGYAEYVCQELKDWGLLNGETSVRVVDIVKVVNEGIGPRSASLGRVTCADFRHHMP